MDEPSGLFYPWVPFKVTKVAGTTAPLPVRTQGVTGSSAFLCRDGVSDGIGAVGSPLVLRQAVFQVVPCVLYGLHQGAFPVRDPAQGECRLGVGKLCLYGTGAFPLQYGGRERGRAHLGAELLDGSQAFCQKVVQFGVDACLDFRCDCPGVS